MYLRKLVHLSGAAFALIAWFNPCLAVAGIAAGIVAFSALEVIKKPGAPWLPWL